MKSKRKLGSKEELNTSELVTKPSCGLRLASFASTKRSCIGSSEVPHSFPRRRRLKSSLKQNVARGCYPSVMILERLCPYKLFGGAALFRIDDVCHIMSEKMSHLMNVFKCACNSHFLLSFNKGSSDWAHAQSTFVSWKRLRQCWSGLHDEAIRRLLLNFDDPFVDSNEMYNGTRRLRKVANKNKVFENNYLTLANVSIPFIIVHFNVFFDVLQAFTLLGLLKVALTAKWSSVDAVLIQSNLAPHEAFRGLRHFSCHVSSRGVNRGTAMEMRSSNGNQQHRSHVSLRALIVLAQDENLVPNALNRRQFALVLTDIEQQLGDMREQRQNVEDNFQKAVEDIFATGHYMTRAERRPSVESRSSSVERRENNGQRGGYDTTTTTSQGEETATTSQDESVDQSQDEDDHDDVNDDVEEEAKDEELHLSSRVRMLDTSVFFQFANNQVYLDRKAVVKQITKDGDDSRKVLLAMDKALRTEKVDLKEAFLFEGRRKGFISLEAIRTLLESKNLKNNKRSCFVLAPEDKKKSILEALSSIEKDVASLQRERELRLHKTNLSICFHKTNDVVYLHTMQVLQALDFEAHKLSKAYYTLGKALQRRGRKLDRCFLSSKNCSYFSKYSFMSLEAVAVLLNMDSGPFAVNKSVDVETFRSDVIQALEERNLDASCLRSMNEEQTETSTTVPAKRRRGDKHLKLRNDWPLIEYKLFVMGNHTRLFVRRQSLFNLVNQLEPLMLASCKSDEEFPMRQILSRCGLNRIQEEFLADEKETYAFMSLRAALCVMVESLDPRLVCLEREGVGEALIDFIQEQVILKKREDEEENGDPKATLSLPGQELALYFLQGSKHKLIFFDRYQVFKLSGLDKNNDINNDPMAPLSLRGMLMQDCFKTEGERDELNRDICFDVCIDKGSAELKENNVNVTISNGHGNHPETDGVENDIECKGKKPKVKSFRNEDGNIKDVGTEKACKDDDRKENGLLKDVLNQNVIQNTHRPDNPLKEKGLKLISLSALLTLLNLDGGVARGEDLEQLVKSDFIKAVIFEAPRLGLHKRQRWFYHALIHSLLTQVCNNLSEKENLPCKLFKAAPVESGIGGEKSQCNVDNDNGIADYKNIDDGDDNDPHWLQTPKGTDVMSAFTKLQAWVTESAHDHQVGEWIVVHSTSSLIHLHLPASKSGGSRKLSFMHPDTSALFSYRLVMQKDHLPTLFINRLPIVVDHIVKRVVDDKTKSCLFKLLYELLILRPCFGCYAPEIVETATKTVVASGAGESRAEASVKNVTVKSHGDDKTKKASKVDQIDDFFVDTAFLSFSASGRHFKGTVRSKDCEIVTNERVSDTCAACHAMSESFVVNRSVLETYDKTDNNDLKKQSVWKIEETNQDECIFLCPQLQCFDTQLPREEQRTSSSTSSSSSFPNSLARTVVSYRVRVKGDLSVSVSLNNRAVESNEKKCKQLGPLLDHIASDLRLCVGYPDKSFVKMTSYILDNLDSLQPEVRRVFSNLLVDKQFKWGRGVREPDREEGKHDLTSFVGTVRLKSCTYRALDDDDRCAQCRLLQRRVDSLSL